MYAALVAILASESTVYAALSSAVHACCQRHTQQHFSYCANSVLSAKTGIHMLSHPGLYEQCSERQNRNSYVELPNTVHT